MRDILDGILNDPEFLEGSAWRRCRFKAGEIIIQKNEDGKTLFFVEEGVVRVLGDAELEDNRKISPGLCDLGEGSIFGDICLYGMNKRTASVVALSDVCLLEIYSDRLSSYLDNHPVQGYLFLRSLFYIMAKRLELANERIGNLLAWGLKVHDIDKYL